MTIVTIENWPGREFEILGTVKGSVVYSKNFGKDFMSAMKSLVGGEVKDYTEMLIEARQIATGRMAHEAEELGADAVLVGEALMRAPDKGRLLDQMREMSR